MLIVSQDKEKIFNFDRVFALKVNTLEMYGEEFGSEILLYDNLKEYIIIGKYRTKERAEEVLQEIIKKYKGTEALKIAINSVSNEVGALGIERAFVYEMPKE